MGIPKETTEKALLFSGLLFTGIDHLGTAVGRLQQEFGTIILESPVLDWPYSSFYREELGEGIKRKLILFERRIRPETIADIKLLTNGIESELSHKGKRTVNIDPGYITLSKIVLVTTKNYCHRIYLGKGIYAEVTLYFKNDTYHPTEFTYQDYKQKEYIDFFLKAREFLK